MSKINYRTVYVKNCGLIKRIMIRTIAVMELLIIGVGLATANICGANSHAQYLVSGPAGVSDNQLSASVTMKFHSPSQARLYTTNRNWCANANASGSYIQVQFDDIWRVVGIVTQGRHSGVYGKWVTYYRIHYSQDGLAWTEHDKQFKGNEDRDTPVVNLLNDVKRMKYLRIYPVQWNKISKPIYNVPCLRFDVLGCKELNACAESLFAAEGDLIDNLKSNSGYSVIISEGYASVKIGDAGENVYIEVIFSIPVNITGFLTKGRPDEYNWIESLTVLYGVDGNKWTKQEGFLGNADNETRIYHGLDNAANVRFLRIYPNCHGYPNLTFDALGCKATTLPYPLAKTSKITSTVQSLRPSTEPVLLIVAKSSALPTVVSQSTTPESLTSETETNEPATLPSTISNTSSTTNKNTDQTQVSNTSSSDSLATVALDSAGQSKADVYCKMVCPEHYTIYQLNEIVRKLQEELKKEKKSTSNYIRSKTSAVDNRVSTTAMGYMAVIILVAIEGVILLIDLPHIVKLTKTNKRALSKA